MFSFSFTGVDLRQLLIYSVMAVFFVYFFFYYKKKSKEENLKRSEERKRYVEEHPDLPDDIKSAISKGDVLKDMTEEQLLSSLGHPRRRKILTVEPALSEVLVYSDIVVHVHMGVVQNWKRHKKLLGI